MKKRESFNSRWGFILACIGSAVGMGNIWMFPTRVSLYGGGSFLIPYFLFVALIGFTGVTGEMSFGRATKSGPVDAFGYACETKGKRKAGEALGLIPVLGSLAMAIGYTVVMGWILKYMIGTFTGKTLTAASVDDFAGAFGSMASAFGNNFWQIVALVIAMIILAFGVGKGIEKVNKVLMPVFFILFVVLGIYVAFQPGAADGYRYIFRDNVVLVARTIHHDSQHIKRFYLIAAFYRFSVCHHKACICSCLNAVAGCIDNAFEQIFVDTYRCLSFIYYNSEMFV